VLRRCLLYDYQAIVIKYWSKLSRAVGSNLCAALNAVYLTGESPVSGIVRRGRSSDSSVIEENLQNGKNEGKSFEPGV
jgi:hypothetical protein